MAGLVRAGRLPKGLARGFEPAARPAGIRAAQAGRGGGQAAQPPALTTAGRDRPARLRRENGQPRLERDIPS